MTPTVRPAPETVYRPLYARMLRLRHLAPSGLLCFVFLEGSAALGVLLALAELVSWSGVIVLPLLVALMVKLNDMFAGMLGGPAGAGRPVATAGPPVEAVDAAPIGPAVRSAVPWVGAALMAYPESPAVARWADKPATPLWADQLDVRQAIARQSAAHRFE